MTVVRSDDRDKRRRWQPTSRCGRPSFPDVSRNLELKIREVPTKETGRTEGRRTTDGGCMPEGAKSCRLSSSLSALLGLRQ